MLFRSVAYSFRREPRRSPQFCAIKVKPKHTKDAPTRQTSKQSDTTIHTKIMEKRAREVDGASGERGAREVVASEEGGGVDLARVSLV
jgi:hypothetical protein